MLPGWGHQRWLVEQSNTTSASTRHEQEEVRVPADAWFEASGEVEIVEHSIASREHDTVLSRLSVPEPSAMRLGMG